MGEFTGKATQKDLQGMSLNCKQVRDKWHSTDPHHN